MRKRTHKTLLYHIVNILAIGLIVESFLCAMLFVDRNAEQNCHERIQETTTQMAAMLEHAMGERLDKLTVFADILAANSENPEALLKTYMETFCRTQYFSAVCVHRANGLVTAYGDHPHRDVGVSSFEEEIAKLPYVSSPFINGPAPEEQFVFQAVPIIRNGETIAVLYGYMSLDVMPTLVTSSAYNGKCQFNVVDGDTGAVLMDAYHPELGNLFKTRQTAPNGDLEQMLAAIRNGESGSFSYSSPTSGMQYYTYYMPMGINNWSVQLTIDEATAFDSYLTIRGTMTLLLVVVILLVAVLITSLMTHNARASLEDKRRLHKAGFVSGIQRALLNVQENPEFVNVALRAVAEEMQAETALLLTFADQVVTRANYWPSTDKAQALHLVDRNIRDDFPMLFDRLAANESVVYYGSDSSAQLSASAAGIFEELAVSSMVLVPILDTSGGLKGAIAAVNVPEGKNAALLESVTYDFFMAIANQESHAIIKKMGTMDYLTRTKNRNSFEAEAGTVAELECDSLWGVYVDVNGLREMNNHRGHKAGDALLCAVADALRRNLGSRYTYRTGGDEFIAFAVNTTRELLQKKLDALNAELAVHGYSVSVGVERGERGADGLFDVEQMIARAEQRMYREKRVFHDTHQFQPEAGRFEEK